MKEPKKVTLPKVSKVVDLPKLKKPKKIEKPNSNFNIKVLKSGITSVKGFSCAGVKAGIKYKNRLDMALIYSNTPCVAAGVFTKNKIRAACVEFDKENLKNKIQAIVINSGVANACTGEEGFKHCKQTAEITAKSLNIQPNSVLVASTGVIGKTLPMDKIESGINKFNKAIGTTPFHSKEAATAIMTTDLETKFACVEFRLDSSIVRIAGMAKGSGMIHPNMATMLSFIVTNANISQKMLQLALSKDVKNTYNMISVDGDTSTNDSVLLLSNQKARHEQITDKNSENFKKFKLALNKLNLILAKKIAADGEGATKLVIAEVRNASSKKQAQILAKSIITSNLTKAAMFGNDANWGRIICAMGYSKANFDYKKLDLSFSSNTGSIDIMKNGSAIAFDEKLATKILKAKEVTIICDLHLGKKTAQAFGCDLSYDYVKINADYRS